eukprot:jgi/Mesvir1/11728/Mv00106-RA.3
MSCPVTNVPTGHGLRALQSSCNEHASNSVTFCRGPSGLRPDRPALQYLSSSKILRGWAGVPRRGASPFVHWERNSTACSSRRKSIVSAQSGYLSGGDSQFKRKSRTPSPSESLKDDRIITISFNFFKMLDISRNPSQKDVDKAYARLQKEETEPGYSPTAVSAREALLDEARDTLSRPDALEQYKKALREAAGEGVPLEIPLSWLPGALMLLQEMEEAPEVIKLGTKYLQEFAGNATFDDILLSLALAKCTQARQSFEAGMVLVGYRLLEEALEALVQSSQPLPLVEEIEASLDDLAPQCILEQLSFPASASNAAAREEAISAIADLVDKGDSMEAPQDGFLEAALQRMLASEVVGLADWARLVEEDRVGSFGPGELYLAALAHLAEGIRSKSPQLINDADCLFAAVMTRDRLDTCTERGVCSMVLGLADDALLWLQEPEVDTQGEPGGRGDVGGAAVTAADKALTEMLDSFSSGGASSPSLSKMGPRARVMAALRAASTERRDGLLAALMMFAEQWIEAVAFAAFRDTARVRVSLVDFLSDPRVADFSARLAGEGDVPGSKEGPLGRLKGVVGGALGAIGSVALPKSPPNKNAPASAKRSPQLPVGGNGGAPGEGGRGASASSSLPPRVGQQRGYGGSGVGVVVDGESWASLDDKVRMMREELKLGADADRDAGEEMNGLRGSGRASGRGTAAVTDAPSGPAWGRAGAAETGRGGLDTGAAGLGGKRAAAGGKPAAGSSSSKVTPPIVGGAWGMGAGAGTSSSKTGASPSRDAASGGGYGTVTGSSYLGTSRAGGAGAEQPISPVGSLRSLGSQREGPPTLEVPSFKFPAPSPSAPKGVVGRTGRGAPRKGLTRPEDAGQGLDMANVLRWPLWARQLAALVAVLGAGAAGLYALGGTAKTGPPRVKPSTTGVTSATLSRPSSAAGGSVVAPTPATKPAAVTGGEDAARGAAAGGGAAAVAPTPTVAPLGSTRLTRAQAENVVREWQKVKAAALGSQHAMGVLEDALTGPMLAQWVDKCVEATKQGWFWSYQLKSLSVDAVEHAPATNDRATIFASIVEAAQLAEKKNPGVVKDKYSR